jgi:transcriptional regulator with XRE-family HTH domain
MLKERLKQLRSEYNLLQKDIAKLLNITTSAYGYYEQGRHTLDCDSLNILAKYFNVSVDYLLGNTDIRETAQEVLKKFMNNEYVYFDLNDGFNKDQLPEVKKEINYLIEYIKYKYKK